MAFNCRRRALGSVIERGLHLILDPLSPVATGLSSPISLEDPYPNISPLFFPPLRPGECTPDRLFRPVRYYSRWTDGFPTLNRCRCDISSEALSTRNRCGQLHVPKTSFILEMSSPSH